GPAPGRMSSRSAACRASPGSPRPARNENLDALPRARFVPAVAVVADRDVLSTLASPTHDPHPLALVERPPPAGSGGAADARATLTIVVDEPERVVARVEATAPGFLVRADQYAPGWTATVNGEARELSEPTMSSGSSRSVPG